MITPTRSAPVLICTKPSKYNHWYSNLHVQIAYEQMKETNSKRLVLDGLTLECLDFSSLDLKEVSFRGSKLKDIRFLDSNLQFASFVGAELISVDFLGANLSNSKFNSSFCSRVNFLNAVCTGMDLTDAQLKFCTGDGTVIVSLDVPGYKYHAVMTENTVSINGAHFKSVQDYWLQEQPQFMCTDTEREMYLKFKRSLRDIQVHAFPTLMINGTIGANNML